MEMSDQLLCLFSEQIEQWDGSYVIEMPDRELQLGDINGGEVYRVAVLPARTAPDKGEDGESMQAHDSVGPPVEEGDIRVVEIEAIGEQGDGIARVERGYVVIVSDAEQGERVEIEIDTVQDNVAFAEVVERLEYYE